MTSHPASRRQPHPDPVAPPPTPARRLRTLLWVVLVLAAGADVVASAVLPNPWPGSASGLLVLACVAGLVGLTRRDRDAHGEGA